MTAMWSVICALFVIAAWALHSLLGGAGVGFTQWHWAGMLAWLLWTFFGVAVVWTFIGERERRAAGMGVLVFGVGSIIIAGILVLLAKSLPA